MNIPKTYRWRNGVTLVEVIFAIGVVLIGLLGLMSILPLAGRRSQDAIGLAVGSSVAQSVIATLESRRYLSSGRLRPVPATTGSAVTNLAVTPAPVSFCIDPMFASATTVPSGVILNGYDGSLFPYYKVNHNPLTDPSIGPAAWPSTQPRLNRVGITQQFNTALFATVSESLSFAENADDLLVHRPKDKTLYANFVDAQAPVVMGGLEYGKQMPSGEFSWIATVNPLPGGVYASVSVVVIRKRLREFQPPTTTTAPATPQGNAVGERLAYVSFAAGFSGGAGGVVHLVSAQNTVFSLRADDWIMLSRNTGGAVFHRWYRVVSVGGRVDGKPETFTTSEDTSTTPSEDTNLKCPFPVYGNNVWRQKVLLDGPDWEFNFVEGTTIRQFADSSFPDNTYATLVEGVVSVTERTVLMSEF